MTIEMCSKRRVRNREGVETDVVDTKCAQSSRVEKRGCRHFSRILESHKHLRSLILSPILCTRGFLKCLKMNLNSKDENWKRWIQYRKLEYKTLLNYDGTW